MEYSKAPISEVTIGINYASQKFSLDKLLELSAFFVGDFPKIEITPPLLLEEMRNFQSQPVMDHPIAGPFLVRRRTNDSKWLLQLQMNRIYLNWIRQDENPPGAYVGFDAVQEKFFSIVSKVSEKVSFNVETDIKLCEITYSDRVFWQDYIKSLDEIHMIMNISSPPMFSKTGYNNIFSRHTFHDEDINGFGFIDVNTSSSKDERQILNFQAILRGKPKENQLREWLKLTHEKQTSIFDKTFTDGIKASWR